MKKENIFLLLRFVVIAVIYFLSFSIFKEEFLLSYKVFVPALVIYFILLMICIFHNDGKTALIKVIIDVFFILIFLGETVWLVFLMHQAPGEAGFAFIFLFQYTPMVILFIVWLVKDIRNYKRIKR